MKRGLRSVLDDRSWLWTAIGFHTSLLGLWVSSSPPSIRGSPAGVVTSPSMESTANLPWHGKLHWQILMAMLAGTIAGLAGGRELVPYVGWLGELFIKLLKMIRSTSITSTRGVTLMSAIAASSESP